MECCDIIQPDVGWCGGVTELIKIANLADSKGVLMIPHGSSVYSYHFVITRHNSPFAEFLMMAPKADEVVPMFHPQLIGEPVPVNGKLKLSDAALNYEPETSVALGFGFRCGFLGLLHLEIVTERLEREFGLDLISTAPSVTYEVTTDDKKHFTVTNPSEFPTGAKIASALRGWEHLRFEVTEDAGLGTDGGRWMHTPDLGIYYAQTTRSATRSSRRTASATRWRSQGRTRSSCTASCASPSVRHGTTSSRPSDTRATASASSGCTAPADHPTPASPAQEKQPTHSSTTQDSRRHENRVMAPRAREAPLVLSC